tara:strand:+ start:4789 stop:5856 length:1068 start_codon:yes stop_codon:yes gene_type:complete
MKNSVKFNPFAKNALPEDPCDHRTYVDGIARILIKDNQKGDSFFTNQARILFRTIAEILIYKEGETSIPEVIDLFSKQDDHEIALTAWKNDPELNKCRLGEKISISFNKLLNNLDSERQWAGVVSSFDEPLDIFTNPRLEVILSGDNEIVPQDFRTKNQTLYIKIKQKDIATYKSIVRVLIDFLGLGLLDGVQTQEYHNVTFILDEFPQFDKMDMIKKLAETGRGYGVNCLFIAQNYQQINAVYGHNEHIVLNAITPYKLIYQQSDTSTAKDIAESIGQSTDKRQSTSKSNNQKDILKTNKSISTSAEGIQLVTTQDILNLKEGECIILGQGYMRNPIQAQIPYYFKNQDFKINQ